MKFKRYISVHHVFTTRNLLESADSEDAAKQQLKDAVRTGTVVRVRRGLYVSNVGRYEDVGVDPCELVTSLDSAAVLSYHTALEAHGIAHNMGFECHFRTDTAKSSFSFEGIRFISHEANLAVESQTIRGKAFGSALVTTREQALVDCLKHPEWSGGIEEVVRSLASIPYLDGAVVATMAILDSASMAARTGWLLEQMAERWKISNLTLESLHEACGNVVSKLDKSSCVTRGWSKRWSMRLPESNEEVESWIPRV